MRYIGKLDNGKVFGASSLPPSLKPGSDNASF